MIQDSTLNMAADALTARASETSHCQPGTTGAALHGACLAAMADIAAEVERREIAAREGRGDG